ncbi:MAG: hypothetical protein QM630_02815 [Microbacterium sp.]
MLPSVRGRELRRIEGNGDDIAARGVAMQDLGDRMQKAANALQMIADGSIGKGLSIDKLKGAASDVYSDLKAAGVRYSPSGAALAAYGNALAEVKSPMSRIVDDCEDSWVRVRIASTALEEATQNGEDTEAQQSEFDNAVIAWRSDRSGYDGYYDTWDAAYQAAKSGLKDANDNGAEDGWLDNALPALEVLGWVLMAVGVVLAVAACIIGAPWLLIAGAIVGLLALANTFALYKGGRADETDLAFAVVGVIPFGKVFGAFRGTTKLTGVLGGFIGLGGQTSRGTVTALLSRGNAAEVFHGAGNLNRHGSQVLRTWFGNTGGPSVLNRLLYGFDGAAGAHFADAAADLSRKARGNLSQFLNGANGNSGLAGLMGEAGTLDRVVNVIDNPIKAATGIASQFGWI